MSKNKWVRWILDPAQDLPPAIIEDNEDGMGILELGENPARDALADAKALIRIHNSTVVLVLCKGELFFKNKNGKTIKTEFPHTLKSAKRLARFHTVPLSQE